MLLEERLVLEAVQAAFATGLLQREKAVPANIVSHNAANPLKRFGIHRNNLYSALIEALWVLRPEQDVALLRLGPAMRSSS